MKKISIGLFVEDILEAMDKIERYIKGLKYDTFLKNEMVIDAVIRNLAIHKYFGVDLSIIWQIMTRNLPETKPEILAILKRINEEK